MTDVQGESQVDWLKLETAMREDSAPETSTTDMIRKIRDDENFEVAYLTAHILNGMYEANARLRGQKRLVAEDIRAAFAILAYMVGAPPAPEPQAVPEPQAPRTTAPHFLTRRR